MAYSSPSRRGWLACKPQELADNLFLIKLYQNVQFIVGVVLKLRSSVCGTSTLTTQLFIQSHVVLVF